MNSLVNKKIGLVVNIRDLVWNLLSQWKAMLIVALIMALLTTGYKYMSDSKAYKEAMNSGNESKATNGMSADEQIDKILSAFPEEDKSTIEYMVQQQEWVDKQKDYINNSILMNVDPTKQRTIILDYYIATEDDSDSIATTLLYGYSSYVTGERVINGIRDVLGAQVEDRYIAELISTPFNDNNNTYNIGAPAGNDDGDAVLEVKVVTPENVDAAKIENVITSSFSDYSTDLSKSAGAHTIKLIRSDEAYIYNAVAVSNRNAVIANIYNIQNNYIKNMEINLSDEQKAAIGSIMAVKRSAKNPADSGIAEDEVPAEKPAAPGISKKYALAGFILGLALYACVYALYVMFKGWITSAGQTEMYTGGRLLGEVYSLEERKGFQKLLHSRFVDSIRYRGKLDKEKQIEKLTASAEAVGKHAEADEITLFRMPGNKSRSALSDTVIEALKNKGIKVKVKDLDDVTEGDAVVDEHNAVIVSGSDTRAADLTGFTCLLNDFDVPVLGNIYIQNV